MNHPPEKDDEDEGGQPDITSFARRPSNSFLGSRRLGGNGGLTIVDYT
jgi:hypothetical protein